MNKKKDPVKRPGRIGSSSLGYTAGFGTLHCCRLPDFTGPVPPSLLISWYSICARIILLTPVENVNTQDLFSMICLSLGQTKSPALAELLSLILLLLSGGVIKYQRGLDLWNTDRSVFITSLVISDESCGVRVIQILLCSCL